MTQQKVTVNRRNLGLFGLSFAERLAEFLRQFAHERFFQKAFVFAADDFQINATLHVWRQPSHGSNLNNGRVRLRNKVMRPPYTPG